MTGLWNEGDVSDPNETPLSIAYQYIPAEEPMFDLLVPVCLSASHIAYGSIRMEPVFMVLGQSSAIAASIGIRSERSVQDIHYDSIKPLDRMLDKSSISKALNPFTGLQLEMG
jgi:hypothetical protein